jgi:hypothetical protein
MILPRTSVLDPIMLIERIHAIAFAPAGKAGAQSVSGFARYAVEADLRQARIAEWATRIRQTDTAVAWLIARPERKPPEVSYPSAVAAYREIAEVLNAL